MVASYCGLCVLKCLLFFVNTILTILSVVIICVGGVVLYLMNSTDEKASTDINFNDITHLNVGAILILVVGILVLLFVFCGCCGACLGAGWMLIWFSVIMACLLIAECVMVGLAWKYTEKAELEKAVSKVYKNVLDVAEKIKDKGKDAQDAAIVGLAFVQDQLKCCGSQGPKDYEDRGMDPKLYCHSESSNEIFTKGCTPVTVDFLIRNSKLIASVVTGTMVAQFVAIIIAMFLYFTIA